MTAPVNTTFNTGTTITSNWLNGVNDAINDATQDITGATPRTLPAKLADTVSVKDFGAVGDGVTDDTLAFTNAGSIASVHSIYVPAGTYNLFSAPTISTNVTWYVEKGAYFNGAYSLQSISQNIVSLGSWAGVSGAEGVTWLSKGTPVSDPTPALDWIEKNATFGSYSSTGAIGLVGAAQTAKQSSGAAIGLIGVGFNNNSVNKVNAWGLYLDSKGTSTAIGPTWGTEVEITNLGSYVDWYDASTRKTYGIALSAGGDPIINGTTNPVTSGLSFNPNGSTFGRGIIFNQALKSFTDSAARTYYKAIVLRTSQQMEWESNTGTTQAYLRSSVTADGVGINLTNENVYFEYASNNVQFAQFGYGANTVNRPLLISSATGVGVIYSVAGSDTDIDLRLTPKGAGNVRFGVFTGTGDVACNGYITIKDQSGTIRKLMTTA